MNTHLGKEKRLGHCHGKVLREKRVLTIMRVLLFSTT